MEEKRCINQVTKILDAIIEENKESFQKEGSFKVRPGYGYDKFYLDRVEGSYDISLYGLIHYIMYEEGIYRDILSEERLAVVEDIIMNTPDAIYRPNPDEDGYDGIAVNLDDVYEKSVDFVGKKLISLGFDVAF